MAQGFETLEDGTRAVKCITGIFRVPVERWNEYRDWADANRDKINTKEGFARYDKILSPYQHSILDAYLKKGYMTNG